MLSVHCVHSCAVKSVDVIFRYKIGQFHKLSNFIWQPILTYFNEILAV